MQFVHDEIFQLQSGNITPDDSHKRMMALHSSKFTKQGPLFDKALEAGLEIRNGWATLIVPKGGGYLGTIRPLEALYRPYKALWAL